MNRKADQVLQGTRCRHHCHVWHHPFPSDHRCNRQTRMSAHAGSRRSEGEVPLVDQMNGEGSVGVDAHTAPPSSRALLTSTRNFNGRPYGSLSSSRGLNGCRPWPSSSWRPLLATTITRTTAHAGRRDPKGEERALGLFRWGEKVGILQPLNGKDEKDARARVWVVVPHGGRMCKSKNSSMPPVAFSFLKSSKFGWSTSVRRTSRW